MRTQRRRLLKHLKNKFSNVLKARRGALKRREWLEKSDEEEERLNLMKKTLTLLYFSGAIVIVMDLFFSEKLPYIIQENMLYIILVLLMSILGLKFWIRKRS